MTNCQGWRSVPATGLSVSRPRPLSQCKYSINRRNVSMFLRARLKRKACIHGMGAMHRSVRFYFNILVGIVERYNQATKDKTLALFLKGTGSRDECFWRACTSIDQHFCSWTNVFYSVRLPCWKGKINVKIMLASLKTLTDSNDCSCGRIWISVQAFLLCPWSIVSSVHIMYWWVSKQFPVSQAVFITMFRVTDINLKPRAQKKLPEEGSEWIFKISKCFRIKKQNSLNIPTNKDPEIVENHRFSYSKKFTIYTKLHN
jgi:hypothetical protein